MAPATCCSCTETLHSLHHDHVRAWVDARLLLLRQAGQHRLGDLRLALVGVASDDQRAGAVVLLLDPVQQWIPDNGATLHVPLQRVNLYD